MNNKKTQESNKDNKKRVNFTILQNEILADPKLFNKNEVLAYMALSYYANSDNECFPSYEKIARIMRTGRTVAIQSVRGLVEKGVLIVEHRKSTESPKKLASNYYTIIDDAPRWKFVSEENKKKLKEQDEKYEKIEELKRSNKAKKLEESKKNAQNTENEPKIESDPVVNQVEETQENDEKTCSICAQILVENEIKYAPIKQEKERIDAMNSDILLRAIELAQANCPNADWYDVERYYDIAKIEYYKNSYWIKYQQVQQILGNTNDIRAYEDAQCIDYVDFENKCTYDMRAEFNV